MDILGPSQQRGYVPLERSRLKLPRVDPSETLTPLNLLGARPADVAPIANAGGGSEAAKPTDLLIRGLFERLPKPDEVWSLEDRARWLRTAASIFALVYRAGEGEEGEIDIVPVKQASAIAPIKSDPGA